jgi:FKBP-type peptidyl-prolyl cis-trans isomerase
MSKSWVVLLLLGLVLAFIAFQARTGIFRRAHPGEPANKYVREMMDAPELSTEDAALIRERYDTATVTRSGLRYLVRAPGQGPTPPFGAEITAHYEGRLLANGQKFDSSYDRGQPFQFRVGMGQVIKGWDEAFASMKRGEKRTLIIPYWLAYGTPGQGVIPPRATLVFEVELVDFK